MGYLNKFSSLQDAASAQVAINLCQTNGFKEVALCLEKPTYGAFIDDYDSSLFVCDPEKLSTWAKMKETKVKKNDPSFVAFMRSFCMTDIEKVIRWDAAVDEQCEILTEGLPRSLKLGVHAWINRIALEYLSYTRKLEVLFGVSRYFLMDFIARGDWTEAGRLDEKKLAERLVDDQRLTDLQKYRIACVYCLHLTIPRLWNNLSEEEKQSISGNDNPSFSEESHSLVLLWSYEMDGHREEKVTKKKIHPLIYAAQQAVSYGNGAALMACWKRLKEHVRQRILIDMALLSVQMWQIAGKKWDDFRYWRVTLVASLLPYSLSDIYIKYFNVPSCYSELMRFFLSHMDEEQQLIFFKKAFQSRYCDCVLKCFLDWPHQNNFLSTVTRLWGILPHVKYAQFLLDLASKYSGDGGKENGYYDFRSLLWTLWEETPEDYKRYVFLDKKNYGSEGKVLLSRLLERSPFQGKDEALFKLFFSDVLQEERRALMHSDTGKNICSTLTKKEKWSFVNWLLEECLPKMEIPSFKKQFIESYWGCRLCLDKLEENREKLVEDLIDWSLELVTEKNQFKCELVNKYYCLNLCDSLLRKGEFTKVERIINFCLSSDDMKDGFKVRFAKDTCGRLVKDCAWEQMNGILAWSVDTEEKITSLKKDLFFCNGINTHYKLVFLRCQWEEVESFYAWFGLSPEEIEKLKKDTVFAPQVMDHIYKELYESTNVLVGALQWCLRNEEMVISFKKEVEEKYFKQVLDKRKKNGKILLDCLVSELLHGRLRKNALQNKTSRDDTFRKDTHTGKRRSPAVIENESSSSKQKKFK